jgi:hypothetical protein
LGCFFFDSWLSRYCLRWWVIWLEPLGLLGAVGIPGREVFPGIHAVQQRRQHLYL